MEKVTSCNFCGSKHFSMYYAGLTDRFYDRDGDITFSILRCKRCDLLMTSPKISTVKDFNKYYPQEEYYAYADTKKNKTSKDLFALFLYDLFYNVRNKFNPLKLLFLPLKPFVRGTQIIPGGKILDVGGGNGFFLERMRDLGMKPYCVEPGSQGFVECKKKNIPVWQEEVYDAGFQDNYFDVITFNSVLEHVGDVRRVLDECKRILKPSGTLIIQVPNAVGFSAKYFKKNWSELDIPRHITHFTSATLRAYIKKSGLVVQRVRPVGSAFQFSKSIVYAAGEKRVSGIERIVRSLPAQIFFNICVLITNVLGGSGRIEVYAKK